MIIVGERINSTRAPIEPAMENRDADFLLNEAHRQREAGSHYLDVNTAKLMDGEPDCMTGTVNLIQDAIPDALLSIDSPNPLALEAGLKAHSGRPILNSITGETERIEAVLPLIREFKPRVIGLTMDDDGLHRDADKRYEIGAGLVELVAGAGIELDDIFIDPLVFPVGAENDAGIIALDIMAKLKKAYPGVHTICGLSNVSFGMPLRSQINQVYMVMAMTRGLDAVIVDPLDRRLMANVVTARMLRGEDPACRDFLAAFRSGSLGVGDPPAKQAAAG
jgi:5-methyltetrahydrofolate--homocysteine methyltransferase